MSPRHTSVRQALTKAAAEGARAAAVAPAGDSTERGNATADDAAPIEAVLGRLDQLIPHEPPARLHGDLWSGNVLWSTDGRTWLIDPAAYGGHREVDLAMMRLFGGFGERAFQAYAEVFPLADGWPERVAVYQAVPLLVHAVLFGGGYAERSAEALRLASRGV